MAPVARPNDRAPEPERSCGNTMSGTPRRGSNIVTHSQRSRSQHKPFVVGGAIESPYFTPALLSADLSLKGFVFRYGRIDGEKTSHVRVIILTSKLTDLHVCFCSSRHRKKGFIKDSGLFYSKKP